MTVIRARSASISIHALREEGDERDGSNICKRVISIHALREEGDQNDYLTRYLVLYFYPRPPRGGRLFESRTDPRKHNFYPRPPRGGRRA